MVRRQPPSVRVRSGERWTGLYRAMRSSSVYSFLIGFFRVLVFGIAASGINLKVISRDNKMALGRAHPCHAYPGHAYPGRGKGPGRKFSRRVPRPLNLRMVRSAMSDRAVPFFRRLATRLP
jgi:hypothetical protein